MLISLHGFREGAESGRCERQTRGAQLAIHDQLHWFASLHEFNLGPLDPALGIRKRSVTET